MNLDFYDDLSDDAALHRWPSDGTKLRAGPNEDPEELRGHAGYAHHLLKRVKIKAGEIDAALQAQGTFEHTSEYARTTPLIQILSAFADVEAHMDAQWARHLGGRTVGIIDSEGRRLVDQAAAGLFAHMKSYQNALDGDRIRDTPQTDLPADVSGVTADTLKVQRFLYGV